MNAFTSSFAGRALAALIVFVAIAAGASAQVATTRAIAELAAAGFSWDEATREVEVTDEGRTRLKDLTKILPALRALQPRTLDLSMCEVLENVDGLSGLRALQAIFLTACPALENVDGIAASAQVKKIYLFESMKVSSKSLDALTRRFPKCYLVLPDGTGLNPPRDKDAGNQH